MGQAARLHLLANAGGQRRTVPHPASAPVSRLAAELGADVAAWLAARYGGEALDIPSTTGRAAEERANHLRAAILDAGLVNPTRSANSIATTFGVTSMWVRKVRTKLKAERERQPPLSLR